MIITTVFHLYIKLTPTPQTHHDALPADIKAGARPYSGANEKSENRGQKVLKTASKRLHFAIFFQETVVGRKYRKIARATATD